jgi:transposase
MRYELSDYEWTATMPMLSNKSAGVRRVNDRRVLNGIGWSLFLLLPRTQRKSAPGRVPF